MASFVNPPSLYTGGNAKFDSTPSVNVYAKLLAQRQAKEDAWDQYMRNLNTKVTPAGMRAQEVPYFNDKVNEIKNFWLQNRRNLPNNPMLQQEYTYRIQSLMNDIARSKSVESGKKPLIELKLDPVKNKLLNSDQVMQAVHDVDQPLYIKDKNGRWVDNPDWKQIDYSQNYFREPDFDFNKNFQGWAKGLTMGKTYEQDVSKYRKEPTTGSVFIPFQEKFSPEQVKQIGENAERFVADNTEANRNYRLRTDTIPVDQLYKYHNLYKSIYGKEPDFHKNPEQLAAAEAIEKAQGTFGKRGEELKSDYEKRQADALARMAYNSNLIASRSNAGGGSTSGTTINDVYDKIEQATKDPSTSIVSNGKRIGTRMNALDGETQGKILSLFPQSKYSITTVDDKGKATTKTVPIDESNTFLHDDNGVISLYKVNERGVPEISPKYKVGDINKVGVNFKSQADVKGKRAVVSEGESKQTAPAPSVYSYSRQELLNGGWTQDQINKAVKAGKLKLK